MAIDFSKLMKKGKGIPPTPAPGVAPGMDALGGVPPPAGLPGTTPDMGALMSAPAAAPKRKAKPKRRGGKGY